MDEILDAEYKVVEHQIAPPLDPSPRWRFQRLARGRIRPRRCQLRRAGKAENRRTAHNLSLGGTEAIRAHPRPNAGGSWKRGYRRGLVSAVRQAGVDILGAGSSSPPRPYYRLGLPHGQVPDTAHRFFARFEVLFRSDSTDNQIAHADSPASFGESWRKALVGGRTLILIWVEWRRQAAWTETEGA